MTTQDLASAAEKAQLQNMLEETKTALVKQENMSVMLKVIAANQATTLGLISERVSLLPKINIWNVLRHYKEIIAFIEYVVLSLKALKITFDVLKEQIAKQNEKMPINVEDLAKASFMSPDFENPTTSSPV